MRPNSNSLSRRDPALAALVGLTGASDFGGDYRFEGEYEFGEDAPTPANMQKAWAEKAATKRREALIDPNRGSLAKIQRYAFGISQTLTLETAAVLSMTGNPQTNFRPQRISTNAPAPGFCRLSSMGVANVGVIVGGQVDAFDFTAAGTDQQLDLPTLSPANAVTVGGNYDALLPSGGYVTATSFRFIVSFKGPASMAGG
jgi:hypothetical protein